MDSQYNNSSSGAQAVDACKISSELCYDYRYSMTHLLCIYQCYKIVYIKYYLEFMSEILSS